VRAQAAPSGRAGRLRATRGRPLPGHRRGDGTAEGRFAHPRIAQSHHPNACSKSQPHRRSLRLARPLRGFRVRASASRPLRPGRSAPRYARPPAARPSEGRRHSRGEVRASAHSTIPSPQRMQNITAPQAQPAARAAGTRPPRPCVRKPPPSGRAGRLRATRGRPLPGHRRGDGTAEGRSAHPRTAPSHHPNACRILQPHRRSLRLARPLRGFRVPASASRPLRPDRSAPRYARPPAARPSEGRRHSRGEVCATRNPTGAACGSRGRYAATASVRPQAAPLRPGRSAPRYARPPAARQPEGVATPGEASACATRTHRALAANHSPATPAHPPLSGGRHSGLAAPNPAFS